MAVEVHPNLLETYKDKDYSKSFVSSHDFQVGYADPTQYPRYQTYTFVRRHWFIKVGPHTIITDNPFSEETGFEMYQWLPSIRSLVGDKTPRKMLIGKNKILSCLISGL